MREKLSLLHNKPLFARSSRDQQRNGGSKGWQHGQPSKPSSSTGEINSENITFLKKGMLCRMYYLYVSFLCVCLLSTVVIFLPCPHFSEAGTKYDGSDWDVPDEWTAVPEGKACIVLSFCVNERCSMYHFVVDCFTMKNCSFFIALLLKW